MSTNRAETPFALIARFTLVVAMRTNIEVANAAVGDLGALVAKASALFTRLSGGSLMSDFG